MDAVIKPWPKSSAADDMTLSDHVRAAPAPVVPKPSREQALAAVRTLIAYAGDNPDREGLRDTPKRVIDAYEELTAAIANARLMCWNALSARSAGTMTSCL